MGGINNPFGNRNISISRIIEKKKRVFPQM